MRAFPWVIGALFVAFAGWYALHAYISAERQGPPAPRFADGEHLGFIHAFTDNAAAMDFDDARWLSGREGEDAAIAAGHCTEATRSECLPNDFFIQNDIRKDERLAVSPDARVVMQTWKMEETGQVADREIPLADLAGLMNDPALHWRTLPYRITITNGAVTRIAEVYIP